MVTPGVPVGRRQAEQRPTGRREDEEQRSEGRARFGQEEDQALRRGVCAAAGQDSETERPPGASRGTSSVLAWRCPVTCAR